MALDEVGTVGLPLQVRLPVRPSRTVTLTSLAVTLRDLDAGTSLSGAAVTSETALDGSTNGLDVLLSWTPAAAADAQYVVSGLQHPSSGADVPFQFRGQILVWPVWSPYDRYLAAVKDLVQDVEKGDAANRLSLRDYRNAVRAAVQAYNDSGEASTYTLSHTTDELPTGDFESLVQYAAGWALAGPLANQATHTEEPSQGMGLVSYRDQQQRLRQQGRDWMAMARAEWGKGGVQTGSITLSDPSPWYQYTQDLEESIV